MIDYSCELPKPLQVQIKIDGSYQHTEVTKLYFKEPTARHCYVSIKQIRGYIVKCAMEMSSKQKNEVKQQESEEKMNAKALLTIISLDADICAQFYNTLQEMLCNGLVFLDGERQQQMKSTHFERLDVDNLDKLIESYLDFFSQYFLPKI